MKLIPTRKMPYRVGIHWLQLVLFPLAILLFSFSLLNPQSVLKTTHPYVFWVGLLMLIFIAFGFIKMLSKWVIFCDNEIQYHLLWSVQRYSYNDLERIQPVNSNNLTARFIFRGGKDFTVALTRHNADYVLEILKERAPVVLRELANLRNAWTPRGA